MTLRARLRTLLILAALVAGAAGVGGYFIPNPERTWADGNIEVHEQLTGGPAGTLLDGSSSLNVAFEQAVQTWNQYLGRVQFVPIRNSSAAIGDGNEVNNVILSDTVFGRAFGDETLAVSSRWYDTRTNRRLEFDIVFNSKWNWNSYRGAVRADSEDIVRTGLHQLGLALGLGQPDDDGQNVEAIMNSNVSDLDTLAFDDISGALSLYGAADPAPGDFRHIKTSTDGTGTATFRLSADRTIPVRFVDHSTGSGIAGADAYLFTEPNGIAMAGLSDPRGRYFTQLAPIRLPVTVTTASTAAVRPIEVPVPLVNPATPAKAPSAMYDWISRNVVGSAWSDAQRRAINLMNDLKAAEVIVDREMKLSEIAEEVDIWQEMIDHGLAAADAPPAVEVTVDTLRTSFAQAVWKQFNPLNLVDDTPYGTAVAARDRLWQTSQMTLGFAGYTPNQKFKVRVVRLPFDVPDDVRKYTEWQIHASALEEPEKPWIPNAQAGVITGYLVDATDPKKPVHGVVTLTGPDPRIYTNRLGYFASKPVPPGFYYVNGGATGYRENRASVTVQGDGKIESVTIALVPLGIKEVVVEPATQTIRDNQVTSFRATVNGMDGKPYLPAPRVQWYSDNPAVATIERDTGNVRAVKAGRALIVASTLDGHVSNAATLIVERSAPCAYTLSSTRFTATDAGGAANVTVTTEADCAWTAVPSPTSMMSIISGGSGPGTGTFRLAVARNTSTSSRTGTVTIQGMPAPNTVTVTQSGVAPACTITLSRTSVSVTAAANSGLSVGVTADAGCAWTAAASGFITITGGSSGSGSGTVIFSVTANTGAARTATLTIANQAVTVSQAAGSSNPVATWSLRGTGCDRSAPDPTPGWINCRSVLDITITATNQSGYVSAIYAWPDSGSFYHGDVQVTRGAAPGSIRINLVNNYVPRCVNSLATTLTIRDGPQSATSAPAIAVIPFTYTTSCG